MALRKYVPSVDAASVNMKSLTFTSKGNEKAQLSNKGRSGKDSDMDIDLREVYFLIMHFLSAGPCERTYGQFWNELLEHQLLPRRYHCWYSRSGAHSGDENDDGMSFPLGYNKLVERYPHIEKDHLVKLLKQLILGAAAPSQGLVSGNVLNAATVPTLLGTGSFSLLGSSENNKRSQVKSPPSYMRWPHMQADQVRGLSLREIGGGFSRHHRAPSVRASCYAIAKPSTMVQKMQNIKKLRGHRNSVYCAIFDRAGRYVITGSDDRLVKIWSMETAYCLASCRGHEGDITDLAVNFNNTLVASASNDCVIRVWRFPDGLPISVLRGHTGAVTAIAFSPRPSSVYQLLSSSDDGSCRIWDARYSQFTPKIYIPKPPDPIAGKNNGQSSSSGQTGHQIFCCAFNASGTVFVTGSSDTLARVWNACKSSVDDSDQPNHEMDVLAGHENDVNYVQFSGCAVASKIYTSDASKEDNLPKFKNTWFTHDNIVTCSRDGSAIIWIPKSRRSHSKVGRWTRAYHLKVPPPPMPPQPPRGGPRQRILPTPRGVNMIVWSLDNRFVLAAIMDCRICVWNAVDGSLVHSLTGHTESTYVLDVHPFNPRIAMSAGYDGKTIVWDIWEGIPIRIYEIGRFKLVDGKFSPDGMSIILSDDVGQLYTLNTGQGESQKDAKYDQFFLGDYRPLIQDTHGNVLDQETQLVPYRRNMQDLLCDSGMIPYPEPYQSMYQQRRLGALGIEWRPSSLRLAIGADFTLDQEYQMLPIADLDILFDPLPEFLDAMDWEPENEVIQSDDTDSEYNVTDSGAEQGSLSSHSSDDRECSADDSEDENEDGLRRSRRKKQNSEVEIMTSSGRRVKRKNMDEYDENSFRNSRHRKLKYRKKSSKKKSSLSKSLRPQRAAARNALNLFSRITGTSTDGDEEDEEDGTEGDSVESESTLQGSNVGSEESDISLHSGQQNEILKGKAVILHEPEDVAKPYESPVPTANRRRLVLKLPNRDPRKLVLNNPLVKSADVGGSSSSVPQGSDKLNTSFDCNGGNTEGSEEVKLSKVENHVDLLEGYNDGKINSWGVVKTRTSKRPRVGEPLPPGAEAGSVSFSGGSLKIESCVNESSVFEKDSSTILASTGNETNDTNVDEMVQMNDRNFTPVSPDDYEKSPVRVQNGTNDGPTTSSVPCDNGADKSSELKENTSVTPTKLRITSKTLSSCRETPTKIRFRSSAAEAAEDSRDGMSEMEKNIILEVPDFKVSKRPRSGLGDHHHNGVSEGAQINLPPINRMFKAVYRRSKLNKAKRSLEADNGSMEASTSNAGNLNVDEETEPTIEGTRRTRSMGLGSTTSRNLSEPRSFDDGSEDASTSVERSSINVSDELPSEGWRSSSRVNVGTRSTRNRRSSYYAQESSPIHKKKSNQSGRSSWLMLTMHEIGPRYIPQRGDEVVYFIQGHKEYIETSGAKEEGPWRNIKGTIGAVEFCKVEELEYSTNPGSGESCCKMTLQFIDPISSVNRKSFKLTLPEVTGFPDFLVERTRYDAARERNWTSRDKCEVYWKNEDGVSGEWWGGRIIAVNPKSPEYPDSPWERFVVQYKSNPPEIYRHSPWELHDDSIPFEQPHIDDDVRDILLLEFGKLDQSGEKAQDYYGVQKLKQASQKQTFLNRFPVPLSLEVIHTRLENNYYRSVLALKHDIEVMMQNAQAYFGRNAEVITKLKHLSNWFSRTLSAL